MSKLLSEVTLHNLQLKNRVVMAPLTRARSGKSRVPNDLMLEYYLQRVSAGLIISEATSISEQGLGWVETPGIYSDAHSEGWKKIVRAIHDHGGKIFLQLWHCGRASHSSFHNGEPAVAPSAIKINEEYIHTAEGKQPHEVPRALKTEEIPLIVEDYRKAAIRAKECGFDGIEVHSANGYLLDQFLQSKTNKRSDIYGGSVENRYRLLNEVLDAVTTVYSVEQVSVRLSPNGVFNDMGASDYRETFTYVIEQLNKYNLAYLHVLDGLGFGFHEQGSPFTLKEIRKIFDKPLMGNCGYSKESAEKAIGEGDADLIAFGRPYLSNPDLVERFANDWPLNPEADASVWYTPLGAKGYTDFPTYNKNK
ncbi:alkene reductase [Candidatus Uabimicrobium amorphum]|uniref:Alkene reductase n=1 Tax=Uabimicrobium amorphum TaxID=2596890 RepID=A0A5S9IUA8_UABAM|nr:alkene reductase [Candidatus Uabimicrobium amorphum]BBM88278.1 alkene reductase [Candidatus Uabimicrobium amorphum]